ncbi:uncharacterized protein OCT59_003461 [Rhizophagus irregularis]|uniref:uncharacterized protein n=1 Tax=Rhizophagus irregularis TaxID=588596 RepID=UPI0033200605|nr:hypothetical protein OCT59_003461 [Rhizophagus irregularis]
MSESGTTKNNSNVHVSETKPIHNRQSKRKRNTYTRPGKNPTNLLHSNQSCDTNCSNEMSDFRNLIYPELILTNELLLAVFVDQTRQAIELELKSRFYDYSDFQCT